jgi:hypothetical protein
VSSKKEKFARFGIASKGFVYVIMGALVAFAALNMGGKLTGTSGVLSYLADKPLGQIILAVLSVGLVGYVFWLIYQAIYDPKRLGNDWKGLSTRIGYVFGGIIYAALAFASLKMALGGSSNSDVQKISDFMNSEHGSIYTIIIALILLGKAIFEIYSAYSKQYRDDIYASELEENTKETLLKFGRFGFTSRGLVFGILGFITLRQGVSNRFNSMNTKTDAFDFIQDKFGSIVLWVIAIGLIGYGVFMFVKARYEHLKIDS